MEEVRGLADQALAVVGLVIVFRFIGVEGVGEGRVVDEAVAGVGRGGCRGGAGAERGRWGVWCLLLRGGWVVFSVLGVYLVKVAC